MLQHLLNTHKSKLIMTTTSKSTWISMKSHLMTKSDFLSSHHWMKSIRCFLHQPLLKILSYHNRLLIRIIQMSVTRTYPTKRKLPTAKWISNPENTSLRVANQRTRSRSSSATTTFMTVLGTNKTSRSLLSVLAFPRSNLTNGFGTAKRRKLMLLRLKRSRIQVWFSR